MKKLKPFFILKTVLISLVVILILYGINFALFVHWSFTVSDYCQKKAEKIVGDKWAELRVPTEEEKQQFPGLEQIAYGFREQLKCEHDPVTLEKFKGWF